MAIYTPPSNDLARIASMEMTAQTGDSDSLKGELAIHPRTLTAVKELLPQYKDRYNALGKEKAVRAGNVVEKNDALTNLEKCIRHFWTGAINRIDRHGLPVDLLKYYQLPVSGLRPSLNTSVSLIPLAEAIISGDAQAVEAGYEAMANPSAEELAGVVAEAKRESAEVADSDSAVDSHEAALETLRTEADALFRKVVNDLRYNLYEEDEPSQRRIMRRYGLVFRSEEETPVAE